MKISLDVRGLTPAKLEEVTKALDSIGYEPMAEQNPESNRARFTLAEGQEQPPETVIKEAVETAGGKWDTDTVVND